MTLVVPFDGSELAEAALVRAGEFATVFDETVVAVSVIPKGDVQYAREHDWLGPEESYDPDAIVSTLHTQVVELCPSAEFRKEYVDRYAPSGAISKTVRRIAKAEDASMVFIGSENAGHVVTSVSSVGRGITSDDAYDVVIVRHRSPSKIAELKEQSPHREAKSDFYVP